MLHFSFTILALLGLGVLFGFSDAFGSFATATLVDFATLTFYFFGGLFLISATATLFFNTHDDNL